MAKINRPFVIFLLAVLILVFAALVWYWRPSQTQDPSNNDSKIYIGNTEEECSTIRFVCTEGYEYFTDNLGCGCQLSNETSQSNQTTIQCSPEEREGEFCPAIYRPVCGYFNQSVQCIKEPCAQTFPNSCQACQNPSVESYSFGPCP